MNSRERVRAALNHKEGDRVPVDLWGSASRIITEEYLKIIEGLGWKELGELARPNSTSQYVDYNLSDKVQSDFRHINISKPDGFTSYQDAKGNTIDEWGIGRKLISGYNAITYNPLSSLDMGSFKKHKWPNPFDEGRTRDLEAIAKDWHFNTDYAITATSAVTGSVFENCNYLCGMDNFMVALYEEPEFAHALIEKLTELVTEFYVNYLKPIAPYVEWVEFTEDFASQTSLMIGPDMFREFFKNTHTQMFKTIKRNFPNVKIWFHSCGALEPLIEDLIDCGIDILNPMQPFATGMDSTALKSKYGNRVCFHGGVDIQFALPGSLDELEKEVKARMEAFAPGGGYIFSPTNHVQTDVSTENFFKMYEFAQKYGKYPMKKTGF